MRSGRVLFGFVFLVLVGACGAASRPGMPAPSMQAAPLEPEPTTIEEAQAQIERAKAATGGQAPAAERAPAAPTAPPAGPTVQSESAPSAGADKSESTGCADACRAIASMRRAVGVLCRLAGDDDARCVDAKKTLDESERRVARCGC